jgi:hypothetical protein
VETRNHIVQFEIIMEKMYEIEVSDWGYGGTKRVIIRILCVGGFLNLKDMKHKVFRIKKVMHTKCFVILILIHFCCVFSFFEWFAFIQKGKNKVLVFFYFK